MKPIREIAALTIREANRKKIVWAAIALGALFILVYALGFYFVRQDIERTVGTSGMGVLTIHQIFNFLLLAGLYTINFMVIVLSVLVSVDTLSGEITSGTIQSLAVKPIHRWQIVVGKWIGFALMITAYLLLLAGGIMLYVRLTTGYSPANPIQGILLIWLNAMLFLSLSLWGGSWLSTMANGVVAVGLFGIAFIGGWVEHFGSFTGNQTAINIGIITSLIFPSEALWRKAAALMESPLVARLGVSPFTTQSVPSPLMTAYAAIFSTALLFLAIRQFSKRDL